MRRMRTLTMVAAALLLSATMALAQEVIQPSVTLTKGTCEGATTSSSFIAPARGEGLALLATPDLAYADYTAPGKKLTLRVYILGDDGKWFKHAGVTWESGREPQRLLMPNHVIWQGREVRLERDCRPTLRAGATLTVVPWSDD